MYNEEDMLN